MIRAVLDTNVLVSGLTYRQSVQAAILDHWAARTFNLILSRHLLKETETTLANEYFVKRFGPAFETDVYETLHRAAITDLTADVTGIATHPEDDLVLATALSGEADYLVTGDKQLLKLGSFEGVQIFDSRAFLAILDERAVKLAGGAPE